MVRIRWLVLNVVAVNLVCGAPREYGIDELITKPRPGEEFVHIQTSKTGKVDLLDNSFATSHRNPVFSKSDRDFETAHKSPLALSSGNERSTRSISGSSDTWKPIIGTETRVSYSIFDGSTTNEPQTEERIVTRTSVKMSKSKKVQKTVTSSDNVDEEPKVEVMGEEGFVDETKNADEEELKIMRKKFSKNEEGFVDKSNSEVLLSPLRLNVPLEDEVKEVNYDYRQLLMPNPVLATTQEPPITTFNYKKMNEILKKNQGFVGGRSENELKTNGKIRYETVGESESIKTAESKAIGRKKEGKQEGKDKQEKEEIDEKEESGFYVLPVNKQNVEENFDFVDADEKVLVPAGSSPGQSSRINVKKGPNGQDYEYEYVYYYYDDDEEGGNGGGSSTKEGKGVSSSTEKVFNGHDGPAKDERRPSFIGTSTSGNKYLPTEAPKSSFKSGKKSRGEEVDAIKNETPVQNVITKNSRSGNRFSPATSNNKQTETANNEVLPSSSGRPGFRPRGRSTTTSTTATTEEIGEERLPPNTRFPPRSRGSNVQATLPQPQETTTRHRNREGGSSNQSRLRIPTSSLLDSSSFRTHSSDASVEDDSRYDADYQRRGASRGQSSESSNRRGQRPTAGPIENTEVAEGEKRFASRKPAEDKRSKLPVEEEEEEGEEEEEEVEKEEEVVKKRRPKVPVEDDESLPKVPFEETLRTKVLEEEQGHRRLPGVPLENEENSSSDLEESAKDETVRQREQNDNSSQERKKESSPTEETAEEKETIDQTSTQDGADQNAKDKTVDFTTEDQSAVGLTSAMMEKVALDLYAILQQTQNENIRTNFVDGNATEVTTESLNENPTEYSTFGDGFTVESSSPTTTTTAATTTITTTTTPVPTTTTTTTPEPTQAAGRGRYRVRGGSGGKVRSRVTTTTTTEPPEEVTSPKTRGRFHGGGRGSNTYGRKPTKPAAVKETAQEDAASEEVAKPAPERSFGERPRNRFRGSPKVSAIPSTTATPSSPSHAPAAGAGRGTTGDRLHGRRRGGGRGNLATAQHSASEESGEVQHDNSQASSSSSSSEEATSPATTAARPTRPRIGGAVRPLRPGPRAPLVLPQRGQGNAASSTTAVPAEHESGEKEVAEPEGHVAHNIEEEVSTLPPGDALTKLRNRPRLRIGPTANHQKPQGPSPTPPGNRRKLVSSLLPKRKPNEEKPVQKIADESEEKIVEEVPAEEVAAEEEDKSAAREEPSTTTTEAEHKGLSGLLAGRRRNLSRRPGTLFSRPQPTES